MGKNAGRYTAKDLPEEKQPKTIQVDYETWKSIKLIQLDESFDKMGDVVRDMVKDKGYM